LKEETIEVLHVERSFVRSWKEHTVERRSETPGTFWNMCRRRMEKVSCTDRVRNEEG